jgi:hypothetical protein
METCDVETQLMWDSEHGFGLMLPRFADIWRIHIAMAKAISARGSRVRETCVQWSPGEDHKICNSLG